jgi:hypothetical protein
MRLSQQLLLTTMVVGGVLLGATALAAPAQSVWTPGAALSASASSDTTGSLSLTLGGTPGTYELTGGTSLRLRLLDSRSNRDLPTTPTGAPAGTNVLAGKDARITVRRIDEQRVSTDLSLIGTVAGALAIAELSVADGGTTPTLMSDKTGVILHDATGPLYFQQKSTRAFRTLKDRGIRVVVPARSGEPVHFTLGRTPLTAEELRAH